MRFYIRDILWLTVVSAVLVGWALEEQTHAHVEAALRHRLKVAEATSPGVMRGAKAEPYPGYGLLERTFGRNPFKEYDAD
jgi:hypothetical protein